MNAETDSQLRDASSDTGARANGFARVWGRRLVTLLAALLTVLLAVIVVGALFPVFRLVAAIGTVFVSFFTLHVVLAGLVCIALALWARSLGGRRAVTVILWLAILATIGALIPLIALVRMAHSYGAPISWGEHLHVAAIGPRAIPDQTKIFAKVDGKDLSADIYLPASAASASSTGTAMSSATASLSAPVISIHGGGYVGGNRSDGRNWDRWFAARGYTVFDVEYRLAPPVAWNLAAPDVACAMAWVASHASEYHVAPDRMLITGQSAGAGLAMQVAYGLGDGTVMSSCGGAVPQPIAVVALYPPDDFALGWHLNTGIGAGSARSFNTAYIGGSPEDFPERYQAVSPIFHARPGLPPTLIAAGAKDHLVPFGGHLEMIEKLNAAGVPNGLVTVPFGEHAYDIPWGSLGGQITRQAVADFLARYFPPN